MTTKDKTTIELPLSDALLKDLRVVALDTETSLEALLEWMLEAQFCCCQREGWPTPDEENDYILN